MTLRKRDIVFGAVFVLVFAGLLIWAVISNPTDMRTITIAISITLVGIFTYAWKAVKKSRDITAGAPAEDEFTKLAKIYAGNRAFFYSMYLWLLIFVLNSSFTENRTMLGLGILGSALIYGVSFWYYKATGDLDA